MFSVNPKSLVLPIRGIRYIDAHSTQSKSFAADTTSQLDVLGIGKDRTQIGVFEETNKVRLNGLLQNTSVIKIWSSTMNVHYSFQPFTGTSES